LKAISEGFDGVEIDGLQHRSAKALEAACEILDPHTQDSASIKRAAPRQQLPLSGPAFRAAPSDPSAPEGNIAGLGGGEQLRQLARRVTEIGIHLEYMAVITS
jgi:hypothetical protein